MNKKIFLTLSVFAVIFLASATSTFATGLTVTWNNSQNKSSNLSDYKGTAATATVTITNNDPVTRFAYIESQQNSCDYGETAKACNDNGKSQNETVAVYQGRPVTRTLSQQTPQTTCGSSQVDFFVTDTTDKTNKVRQGPFWGLAYTGKTCPPQITQACPVTAGGKVDGNKPNDGYPNGLHWIFGLGKLKDGADWVYYQGPKSNPKHKVLQCFYPKNENKKHYETNFIEKGNLVRVGWLTVSVQDAISLNLNPVEYWAINTLFNTN